MWKPVNIASFEEIRGKKVKIVYWFDSKNTNQYESEGELLDIVLDREVNEFVIIMKVLNHVTKYGNKNRIYISKIGIIPIRGNNVISAEIECDEIENLVLKKSTDCLCFDIAYNILEFSGKYIPL